jgi:hypothetical protein
MVLEQKQIQRPVEQNKGPGYEPTELATLFLKKASNTYNGEKIAFSTNVAEKSGYMPAKN